MVLSHRIITIGLTPMEMEILHSLSGNYVFICKSPQGADITEKMDFDALLISYESLASSTQILVNFPPGKIFVLSNMDLSTDFFHKIARPLSAEKLQKVLLQVLGEIRQPPESVGKLKKGMVVKNKLFPDWGLGVIIEDKGNGNFAVKFSRASKTLQKNTMICHKSVLRTIFTLKEFDHESSN